MSKSNYQVAPQSPMTPMTPGSPPTPGTPQYGEKYPLTGQSSYNKYPLSPPPHDYDTRAFKQGSTYVSVANNAYDPDVVNAQPTSLLHQDLLKRDRRLKTTIRILRVISRTLLTILTLAITVQEGRTVVLFYQTRNDMQTPPGATTPRGPWAKQTQVWSSLLLFSSSVVTSLLGVLSVFAYAISTKTSNAISSLQTKFGIAVEAVHVLIWVAVAAAYRVARNGHDLWGWSCSPLADNIQPTFEGVVNFGSVCDRSGVNFDLSITSSGLQIASLFIWILVYKRLRTQQWLKKVQLQPNM
ncbi:hyphal anastamosis-8 protein [Rutstroemia sp. NJR-2017a WRK4]|nr:hyphal anastamosis-8 protein [Rutstroemia sp. NJR-2017a WRK4]